MGPGNGILIQVPGENGPVAIGAINSDGIGVSVDEAAGYVPVTLGDTLEIRANVLEGGRQEEGEVATSGVDYAKYPLFMRSLGEIIKRIIPGSLAMMFLCLVGCGEDVLVPPAAQQQNPPAAVANFDPGVDEGVLRLTQKQDYPNEYSRLFDEPVDYSGNTFECAFQRGCGSEWC